jgi:OOP family OmpA-OmpF porin
MKKGFLTALAFSFLLTADAQFTQDYLRAADGYFRKGDYYSAAQYYEKYLGAGGKKEGEGYRPYVVQGTAKKGSGQASSVEQVVYNTAESYRKLNYPSKATDYYRQAVSFDRSRFPLALYWYAVTQRALANYQEAEKSFASFLADHKEEDQYSEMARREIANLQFIQQELARKDLNLFTITNAGSAIGDTGAVYAPLWADGQTLMVTATRPEGGVKKAALNSLYRLSFAGGVAGSAEKLELPQPEQTHQGVASLSANGQLLFFTRWSGEGQARKAAIYLSRKGEGKWSEGEALGPLVNAAGANAQQPCLMPDGSTLLFASDKPGGLGGFDIWMATVDAEGRVTNVRNAGEAINTKYDEQAPSFHVPSATLVFASNGRTGMGGMDLFYSKEKGGQWAAATNFGYPVNSVKDDLYFASRGSARNILEDVLLSSDRNAACCLQLISLKKQNPVLKVEGLVVSCETGAPLPGATVSFADPAGTATLFTQTTDATGRYSLTLEAFQPLKAIAAQQGYTSGSISFHSPADEASYTLTNPNLCLTPIPVVGTTEVMDNVYYAFNKAVVLEESHAALNKLVTYLNQHPTLVVEIGGHTDSKGNDRYNQRLSEQRAQSVVDYLVQQGIARERLTAKGYGETMPIAPNENEDGTDNPAGREKNRRTEFKVIRN